MKRQIPTVFLIVILFAISLFSFAKADNTNLAPFPTGWRDDHTWILVPSGNIYHDTVTTYGGSYTLKIDPSGSPNSFDAFDFWAVNINPGDHVVIKVWIKTAGSGTNYLEGAFLGLDYYTAGGSQRIAGMNTVYEASIGVGWSPYHSAPDDADSNFIHWGTDWTQVIWDFNVPSLVEGDGILAGQVPANEWVTPGLFVPWCELYSSGGYPSTAYSAWFSNMEIYVNPSGSPTPSPSPTPSSSPSPSPTPTITPTPNPSATLTPTPIPPTPSPTPPQFSPAPHGSPDVVVPTPTAFVSQAQAATNNVFTNVYIALGILVISTLIAGCYIIIIALNNNGENLRFGVGICLISFVELTVGLVIVSAFQNSMGTVQIILSIVGGIV